MTGEKEMGARWRVILRRRTGWLDEQNKAENYPVGW
jgi:hypothetical protein